jgi:hypothetical protein
MREAINLALVQVVLSAATVKQQHMIIQKIVLAHNDTVWFFIYLNGKDMNPQIVPAAMPARI